MKHWARRFFTIWSAQALSLFGSELVQFALIWWLTSTTGSATVLATATLVGLLPQIIIGPFAGALVDRWDRRRTMIVADGAIALSTLALALINAGGNLQPWHVYLLMFVRSTGGGFHWPAMSSSTTLMVPEEQLSRVAVLVLCQIVDAEELPRAAAGSRAFPGGQLEPVDQRALRNGPQRGVLRRSTPAERRDRDDHHG